MSPRLPHLFAGGRLCRTLSSASRSCAPGRAGCGAAPGPQPPSPHPHPPIPIPSSALLLQWDPVPGRLLCWGLLGPSPPAPSCALPRGGWPRWAQRSPQPRSCHPPSRRAPARGGGGRAGAGPWAAAWAADGVFPAMAHACRHRSLAPRRCTDASGGCCAATRLWAGSGTAVGAGVHQLPPDWGSCPPEQGCSPARSSPPVPGKEA